MAKGPLTSFSCDLTQNGFTTTTQYIVGQSGEQITAVDGQGNWKRSNVYAAGAPLATYDANGLHFNLSDALGTKRVQVNTTGVVEESCQSLPFGDQLNCIGADDNKLHFTAKERDTESGNDYFGARYLSSNVGRFLSPDFGGLISGMPDPVPWANFENPQSLNLYSYVGNNPLSKRDETGHVQVCGSQSTSTNANGDMMVHANCHEESDFTWRKILNWHQSQQKQMKAALNEPQQMQLDMAYPVDFGALEFLGDSVADILTKAESAVGDQSVKVANRQVADQAAKDWVGKDATTLTSNHGGEPGSQIGLKSADGTKVARFNNAESKGYINLENKVTGSNLHVRFK